MPLKTPEQYIQSLRDGRVTYWGGERIDDITQHPRFKVPLQVAARDYDVSNPEFAKRRTYTTETGGLAHRLYQVPKSEEDLRARLLMMEDISLVGSVTGVYMALLSVKDAIAAHNKDYAANLERVYLHARENDLRAAEVITDAKGDRKRRANEQDDPDLYLRIVERKPEGIVVRGAKLHITGASLCHELVVMPTKGMLPNESDYSVSFSIPVNTPGVKIINRSFANTELNPFDYPASSHHSMPEGFVIFDDVLVPWDRVFLAGETELAGTLAQSLGLWERTIGLLEAWKLSQVFIGAAQIVNEQQGKDKDPIVLNTIAELIAFSETLHMSLDYSCRHYEKTPSGMVYPNTLGINVGKYHYAQNYHQVIKMVQELSGGLVMTLPEEAELRNPESGAYLRKYLHTRKDVDVEERMRMFNLVRDLTADSFGGWQQVVALQSGGGLPAQRIMMSRSFDMQTARAKARAAAGIVR